MAENSRTTCFPHCVISCFGIRKRQPHNRKPSEKNNYEKFHEIAPEKLRVVENCVKRHVTGSTAQHRVNGEAYSLKSCDLKGDTDQRLDSVLIQPEKSELPPLDECMNDIPDSISNGHATHEIEPMTPDAKHSSSDCTGMLNVAPNDVQPVDLSHLNRIMLDVNKTEQTHEAEDKTEFSAAIEVVFDKMTSPKIRCESDASQDVHMNSDKMKKEYSVEGTTSEEIINVHIEKDNKCHAHFRELLDAEKEKLTSLVLQWSELLSTDINVEVQDEIRSVTGQTNLIITERFTQFSRLISQSEGNSEHRQSDGKVIMSSDLQGFWEMILFQVKDVLNKFERLDTLRKSNWDLKHLTTDISTKKTPKKKLAKNGVCADSEKEKARRLAARKRIAEARERMKKQNEQTPEHGAIIL